MTLRIAVPSCVLLACAIGCEAPPPTAATAATAAASATGAPATAPSPTAALPTAASPTAASPTAASLTAQAAADAAVEAARVAQYIDARYHPTDVRYSFRNSLDEPIDCIDFAAQPGVRALVAAGQPVPEQRRPTPPADVAARTRSREFTAADASADRDADGHARVCPDGTVPMPRLTPEHIRAAGGLDAYRAAIMRRKPAPPTPGHSGSCDFPHYAHVIGAVGDSASQVYAGSTNTSIYAPSPVPVGDHSLSQTWTYSGYNSCDGVTSTVQSVETGWLVDSVVNKGDYNPHLFVYSTTDGYHQTGCYNGEVGAECTQWINSSPRYYPGYPLPISVEGGARHELGLLTIMIDQWWIQVSVDGVSDYMGYYVYSAFSGTMRTHADNFEVGGEVYDPTDAFTVPMGSGAWPALGLADAAYHHDVWAYGLENGAGTTWDTLTAVDARPGSYVYSSAPAGGSGWENYFYFGNALHLIIHWPPIILDQP